MSVVIIGCPDLLIRFTSTVSHNMARCVENAVDERKTDVIHCHTSSGTTLTEILAGYSA